MQKCQLPQPRRSAIVIRMLESNRQQLALRIANRLSQLPEVEAVAVAGSQTGNMAEEHSDIDIYIYPQQDIPPEARLKIGREFSNDAEIVDFWGPGLEWDDPQTGIHVDTIYFTVPWMEDQLARVLDRHEAWLGYTTCFWHTVRVSQVLFDRSGWFEKLQEKASQPYPEALVKAIIALNYPVLRDIFPSYLTQIEKAAARDDLVSLNHRAAAFLASYFDILFALNRQPHPGEKRLLEKAEALCSNRPPQMRAQITGLLSAQAKAAPGLINALVDGLDVLLRAERLL